VTDYEVLIMFDPELAEDRQQEVVDRIRTQVVEGGESGRRTPLGDAGASPTRICTRARASITS